MFFGKVLQGEPTFDIVQEKIHILIYKNRLLRWCVYPDVSQKRDPMENKLLRTYWDWEEEEKSGKNKWKFLRLILLLSISSILISNKSFSLLLYFP